MHSRTIGRPPNTTDPSITCKVSYPQSLSTRLAEVMHDMRATSISEVFRRSLVAYVAMWELKKKGSRVFVRDTDGTEREIIGIF